MNVVGASFWEPWLLVVAGDEYCFLSRREIFFGNRSMICWNSNRGTVRLCQ